MTAAASGVASAAGQTAGGTAPTCGHAGARVPVEGVVRSRKTNGSTFKILVQKIVGSSPATDGVGKLKARGAGERYLDDPRARGRRRGAD